MKVERLIKKASSKYSSSLTLSKLALNNFADVRTAVADNPNTPLGILMILVDDKTPSVRAAVASNPNISDDIAWKLCRDKFVDVHLSLASNPKSLPLGVLEILTNDAAGWVKGAAATNQGFPSERLRELASSEEWVIRSGVIENPNTPLDSLAMLSFDILPNISKSALKIVNNMPEEEFKTKLCELNYEKLYGLPRNWIVKVLAGLND